MTLWGQMSSKSYEDAVVNHYHIMISDIEMKCSN